MTKYHLHNRPERELTKQEDIDLLLEKGKYASVALCRDNVPYIVTLSYGYDIAENVLYFHCAKQGLKMDYIKSNSSVCATIINDGGYLMGECAHKYQSLVFWGKMSIVEDKKEKQHGMQVLLKHLEQKEDVIQEKLLKSEHFYSKMDILKLEIGEIHGKAGQ